MFSQRAAAVVRTRLHGQFRALCDAKPIAAKVAQVIADVTFIRTQLERAPKERVIEVLTGASLPTDWAALTHHCATLPAALCR